MCDVWLTAGRSANICSVSVFRLLPASPAVIIVAPPGDVWLRMVHYVSRQSRVLLGGQTTTKITHHHTISHQAANQWKCHHCQGSDLLYNAQYIVNTILPVH